MRVESCRRFWVGTARKERDEIRGAAAAQPSDELASIIVQIQREDNGPTKDCFWEHQRDQGAAADEEIYKKVFKDIVSILDEDSKVLFCKFKRLFQFLFGENGKNKVDDTIRKWSSLPPLPVPETARHMADDLIRQQHPELDLEKAQSLEELEQRYQCVVHYGTWAMQGRTSPDLVFRTVDTIFGRGRPRKVQEDIPGKLSPEFRKAAGLGSGSRSHFVADWTGYRIFLLYANHQPVRNYAHRIMGKLPPKPNDLWLPGRVREREEAGEAALAPKSEPDIDSYDSCYTEPLSPEPETLYEADIQGPAYIPSDLLYADSTTGSSDKSSASSYLDHGRIAVEGREFKKRKTDNRAHGLVDGWDK
ncbi:hypothetical protein DL771_006850 [Monosporascus sp. 5C6A]|nr:hypothetical protein DL771_006850 [Monosporascus sp. 5C6A]